jgi:hypothetical protein
VRLWNQPGSRLQFRRLRLEEIRPVDPNLISPRLSPQKTRPGSRRRATSRIGPRLISLGNRVGARLLQPHPQVLTHLMEVRIAPSIDGLRRICGQVVHARFRPDRGIVGGAHQSPYVVVDPNHESLEVRSDMGGHANTQRRTRIGGPVEVPRQARTPASDRDQATRAPRRISFVSVDAVADTDGNCAALSSGTPAGTTTHSGMRYSRSR